MNKYELNDKENKAYRCLKEMLKPEEKFSLEREAIFCISDKTNIMPDEIRPIVRSLTKKEKLKKEFSAIYSLN